MMDGAVAGAAVQCTTGTEFWQRNGRDQLTDGRSHIAERPEVRTARLLTVSAYSAT